MPTAKPRITITLTEHQHAVLSQLSTLQKASMSSIVVDLVDTTLPVLERLASVLANAASAPQNVLSQLRKSAETAERDFALSGSSVVGLLEELLVQSSGGESKERRARQEVAPGVKPPTSNRGVRITSPQPKIAPISPMKKGEKNGRAQK